MFFRLFSYIPTPHPLPPVGLSGTSPIRLPHLRRQASTRLHALIPAKCCTSPDVTAAPATVWSSPSLRAAATSCAETFRQCHAALSPEDLPALVSRCYWACLHTCFGCSACSTCLVACVASSECLPPNAQFLTFGPVPVAMRLEWSFAFRPSLPFAGLPT